MLQRFHSLILKQRLHPVSLLVGREGIGKVEFAKSIAGMLLCRTQSSCGTCEACQLHRLGKHPDFLEVKPEKALIRLEDIDPVLDFASLYGMGQARVVVLPNVEKLTKQAANRLLKTLEEPLSRIYFFLTTSRIKAVIPTIRSRAAISHVSPPAFGAISQSARAEISQEWYDIHASSMGLLEKAMPLLKDWQQAEPVAGNFRGELEALSHFLRETEQVPSLSYIGELAWNRFLKSKLGFSGGFEFYRCMGEYRAVLDQIKQRELEQNIKLADQLQLQAMIWRLLEMDQLLIAN